MKANRRRGILAGLLLTGTVVLMSCSEDNPDECYSDADCPPASNAQATICLKTYYNSGIPSGGHCVQCIDDSDCTDPTAPTCDVLFNACVCAADSGICGLEEGDTPHGGMAGSGAGGDGSEAPDDAGQEDGAVSEPGNPGQ